MPPEVSALAISEFFTLSGAELQAVLSRYGVDMRLGAALQIGFLKMCGRPLDKLQRVPAAVLEHLCVQVGGSPPDLATLRAFYSNAPRVLYRHQQSALDVLGLIRFDSTSDRPDFSRRSATRYAQASISTSSWPRRASFSMNVGMCWLQREPLGELAKLARETVERDIGGAIERAISPQTRARWVEQLFESRADGHDAARVSAGATRSAAHG